MIDIKALCKQYANKEICKYTKQSCTIEIEYPFLLRSSVNISKI